MSIIELKDTQIPLSFTHLVAQGRSRLREWQRNLRSRYELGTMPERDLKDIGITKAERNREIAKPFWQP